MVFLFIIVISGVLLYPTAEEISGSTIADNWVQSTSKTTVAEGNDPISWHILRPI
jgi:hypothetical protein